MVLHYGRDGVGETSSSNCGSQKETGRGTQVTPSALPLPFFSVQVPSPWGGFAYMQGVFFLLNPLAITLVPTGVLHLCTAEFKSSRRSVVTHTGML